MSGPPKEVVFPQERALGIRAVSDFFSSITACITSRWSMTERASRIFQAVVDGQSRPGVAWLAAAGGPTTELDTCFSGTRVQDWLEIVPSRVRLAGR